MPYTPPRFPPRPPRFPRRNCSIHCRRFTRTARPRLWRRREDASRRLVPRRRPARRRRARLRRDAWGASWPVSGGAADDDDTSSGGDGGDDACGDDRDDDPSSRSAYHVVAAASGGNAGSVRVCREGGGRLTSIGVAAPGPNAGVSSRDRAVTRCHLACGGRFSSSVAPAAPWSCTGAAVFSRATVRLPRPRRRFDSWTADSTSRRRRGTTTPASPHRARSAWWANSNARGAHRVRRDGRRVRPVGGGRRERNRLPGGSPRGTLTFRHLRVQGEVGRVRRGGGVLPPVVGTEDEPAPDPNADADADPRSASNSRAMGSERGAATLVLAGTGSSVAFLDARTGAPVGRACQPKTPSAARPSRRSPPRASLRPEASKTTSQTPDLTPRRARSGSTAASRPPPRHTPTTPSPRSSAWRPRRRFASTPPTARRAASGTPSRRFRAPNPGRRRRSGFPGAKTASSPIAPRRSRRRLVAVAC